MMRNLFVINSLLVLLFLGCQTESANETNETGDNSTTTNVSAQVVEASCGECQFGMEGTGCDLAVRFDGKSYYVDGSSIDDHGDAHGTDGMCNCIRKAKVSGKIKDNRFVATSFEVLPVAEGETD